MITVNGASFWLAEFVMTSWFIYFQYYWFPQLRPRYFSLGCVAMGAAYASADWWCRLYGTTAWTSALPALLLLGIEGAILFLQRNWQFLPAFITVSIIAYLLTEFVDTLAISGTMFLTNGQFAVSLWGTVTELTLDTMVFALLGLGLWATQAPMENMIQFMLGRTPEYLLLIFMASLGLVFMLFEYSLQVLNRSADYVLFLAGITGVFMVAISLSAYMLVQTHWQHEHATTQVTQQRFQEQYSSELDRQMRVIRKFRHDYQNMLLGLGGYLNDHDYDGFRQLYIDIRSGWTTSNAADLTIDDLTNMPAGVVRYELYHDYLLAQRLGVNLFVNIPKPLTATVVVGRQVGQLITRALPAAIVAVEHLEPAMVTLKITEGKTTSTIEMTFPVAEGTHLVGRSQLVGEQFELNLEGLLTALSPRITSQLRVKRHWGQLLVILPLM